MSGAERVEIPDFTDPEVRTAEIDKRITFYKERLAANQPELDPESFQNQAALMAIFDVGFGMARFDQTGEWK